MNGTGLAEKDSLYDSTPVTLRELLHLLTDEGVMLDEPVHVDVYDMTGKPIDCLVTGLSLRQWDGRGIQSLTFERNRDNR